MCNIQRSCQTVSAWVAKLVDAPDSNSGMGNHVRVRVSPQAPNRMRLQPDQSGVSLPFLKTLGDTFRQDFTNFSCHGLRTKRLLEKLSVRASKTLIGRKFFGITRYVENRHIGSNRCKSFGEFVPTQSLA